MNWLKTYLIERRSQVCVNGCYSKSVRNHFGVPQGSVLGPILFTLYISPIGKIIQRFGISYHIYADDIQLYCDFNPDDKDDMVSKLSCISSCISTLRSWMIQNFLKLNEEKTEFTVMGPASVTKSLESIDLKIDNYFVTETRSVKNLGVNIAKDFSLSKHVANVCRKVNFHLRNIGKIRKFINTDTCRTAVVSLVLSRIDYCNALLTGLKQHDLQRLQRLQNKAARIIYLIPKMQSITPFLIELHWLPVKERINYKLLLLMFKIINGSSPVYLQNCVSYVNPGRHLRSVTSNKLNIPRTFRRDGEKRFAVCAPKLWNDIPLELKTAPTLETFKKNLKTFLFKRTFHNI